MHDGHGATASTSRLALDATVHCLTGCAIGEVLGLVVSTALALGIVVSIFVAIVLAFFFGYSLTFFPLLGAGVELRRALGITLASDTVSIVVMELVDNAVILLVPGAMTAGLADPLFWASLALSLVIAFVAAFPVNRWLIGRGQGHAVVMRHHAQESRE